MLSKGKSSLNFEFPTMDEGFYTGDVPNKNLKSFIDEHNLEHFYNPESDNYDVPIFDRPIETTKATAIYNMHSYWSKKPHEAVRQYIRHYTKKGDLVLDPFCGSGGTALAALLDGRKVIGIDRSSVATFITKNYCTPINIDEYKKAIETIENILQPLYDLLYKANCPECGKKAIIGYTVFSRTVECLKCMSIIPVFPEGNESNKVCIKCSEPITGKEKVIGFGRVRQTMKCIDGCKKKSIVYDFCMNNTLIPKFEFPRWYDYTLDERLSTPFPNGLITRQPIASGALLVKDLYTERNLLAGKLLYSAINTINCSETIRDTLKFTFNGISLNISKMLRETKRAIQSGTYYLPPLYREIHVWNAFEYKASQVIKGMNELTYQLDKHPKLIISTQSAVDLHQISANSIDYIFTDPPYGSKVQFAEANFAWEVWLGLKKDWWNEEIIVNAQRSLSEDLWFEMMLKAFKEAFRVLKPGRVISICFHGDTSLWEKLQDCLYMSGFIPEHLERAIYIDAKEKSYKQRTADNVQLRDLVVNFRKPKPGENVFISPFSGHEDQVTFYEKVKNIIISYLYNNPGSTKDRVYDEVISNMVRTRNMKPHNFDELLNQVAEGVPEPIIKNSVNEKDDLSTTHLIIRWFLKDGNNPMMDAAESAKEDAAAEIISKFITERLKNDPAIEGVHYSDIFEHYVFAVKDKPRRQPVEWLLDYFYKTDSGTYRVPSSEEELSLKNKARMSGINRQIKRYISYIEQGINIPEKLRLNDATLVEWVRHCKRSGMFEQGKILYEKGGLNLNNLNEVALVDVEEDYQVCVRMITRTQRLMK